MESSRTLSTLHLHGRTGSSRLLGHCEAIARVTGESHSPARARLECELGPELAARLVGALARRPAAAA